MKNILFIMSVMLMLVMTSCYTRKKAIDDSVKAYVNYPADVAELHSKWFPIRTSTVIEKEYVKGKDSVITDSVFVDCTQIDTVVKVRYKYTAQRVDTLKINQVDTVESTAKINALEHKIKKHEELAKEYDILIATLEKDLKAKSNIKIFLWCWFGLSILAFIAYCIYKFKTFKIKREF